MVRDDGSTGLFQEPPSVTLKGQGSPFITRGINSTAPVYQKLGTQTQTNSAKEGSH